MNKTEQFLKSIDNFSKQDLCEKVWNRARLSLLDYICVTLAGAKYHKQKLQKYFEFSEPESGNYTAIGLGKKLVMKEAVFLNGLNGHALDFDDGTNTGIIHLGSPIFSVLLPVAQKYHLTYEKVLKAAIIGYETSFTMALSIQPKHKLLGYHATGTCGTLGATMAICYALDFNENEIKNAFATACVSASGMLKVLDDGSELKPYNVAKTSLLALTSAQMAKAGFKGHPDALSGDRGFLKMMTGESDVPLFKPLYNGTYAIEKTYTKPYAACRYCHPAIEAAIYLRNNYSYDEIERIDVDTYSLAVKGHEHTEIPSVSSAKMSIPYSVAVATITGKAGLAEYTEHYLNDSKVKELCKKIRINSNQEFSNVFPEKQFALVKVTTSKGIFKKQIDFPKGEPENRMTEKEFKNRFMEMCSFGGKSISDSEKIYDLVTLDVGFMDNLFNFL